MGHGARPGTGSAAHDGGEAANRRRGRVLEMNGELDPRVYWIWAQRAFGAGSQKPWKLSRRFPGGLREFYESGPSLWNRMELVSEREAGMLYAYGLSQALALLEYCDKCGEEVITPECEKYPEALRNIFDPPAVLYLKGKLPDVDRIPTVAIVGARKATEASVRAAEAFGYQLASGGAVVVSGCALGIDAASLMGALSAAGTPVSVLPTSLDSNYVVKNAALRSSILEHGGCLLTEQATEQNIHQGTFQVRNRIISGLSWGTLVIQAAQRSGTLITANHAQYQNRDVFVYPGKDGDKAYEGGRLLLEDGAKAVSCGEEILEEYQFRIQAKRTPGPIDLTGLFDDLKVPSSFEAEELADSGTGAALSENAGKVLRVLGKTPVHISVLEEKTGLPVTSVLVALTELEMTGEIRSYPGRRYSRA